MQVKVLALAAAVFVVVGAPAAGAIDCHTMIGQFNANNAASAELQQKVEGLDSCDAKWLGAQDERADIWVRQVALRTRLEQSCKSLMRGGNSLADLQLLSQDFHKNLAVLKASCDIERQFKSIDDNLDEGGD